MKTNDIETKKSSTESTLSLLISVFILFNGLIICITNIHSIWGIHIIYIASIIPIITGIIALVYSVLLIKNIKKISYKKSYLAIWLIILFLVVCHVFLGNSYMKDVLDGTETVSTDYFSFRKEKLHLYIEDEYMNLYLSESQYKYLVANESELDEDKILKLSDNIYINGHQNSLVVEYYPNSKTIANVSIN